MKIRGTLYACVGRAAVVVAHADAVAAYDEAAARPSDFTLAGDLLGLTLAPGVHTNVGAVANTGTVTLDVGGDARRRLHLPGQRSVAMAAGSHVVLVDGAQAKNVFWQVNGAGAVGADAEFAGRDHRRGEYPSASTRPSTGAPSRRPGRSPSTATRSTRSLRR